MTSLDPRASAARADDPGADDCGAGAVGAAGSADADQLGELAQPSFAQWVAPSLLAMTRLARRLAPSGDADDVVQESLTHAWRKWHQFDPMRGTPQSWLLAITADRARSDRVGRLRRRRLIDDLQQPPDAAAPVVSHDEQLSITAAIATLTDRQQLAVNLHYFVGLPIEEAAAVLGCSAGTVKSTLFDARRKLRTLLGDDDDD